MSSPSPPTSSASVRNILTLLASRNARLIAGAGGLERRVTWASRMRARLPAFESVQGGELALLTLTQLRRLDETLPHLIASLHQAGVAAVAVAALSPDTLGNEACAVADHLHLPLILLPPSAPLEAIEREVITIVVGFRGEIERKATEISHQLMQLSISGAGISGICTHLAASCNKWVIVEDTDHHIRLQASPDDSDTIPLPASLTDEVVSQLHLIRVTVPILIRHETAGYLSFLGRNGDLDVQERITLGQVAPILALEFARERERSEVESRYQAEAFMDVLQGNYQQPEEMLARARLLGYDLTVPQIAGIFEISTPDSPNTLRWSRQLRNELLREWPLSWIVSEGRRITALLPLSYPSHTTTSDEEAAILKRLERIQGRMLSQNGKKTLYSGGIGRGSEQIQGIPQSFREAQQALDIGRRLFGEGTIHIFARLGIYRLLFYLDGHDELNDFYQETLGPLLQSDTRGDGTLIETLEVFFRCNGNLSETARLMHLHRNSLLYRLGRIEEILGRSLEDSELRLSLQIALKIHHVHHKNE